MVTRFRDNPGAKLETAVRYTFCEYALPPGQVRIRAATSSDLGGGCRRDEQGDTTHRDRTNETPNHCVPPLTQREENAASCQCPQSNTSSERGGDRLFPGDGTTWRSPESALSDSEFIPLQTGSPRIPPRPLERLRLTCDGAGRQNCCNAAGIVVDGPHHAPPTVRPDFLGGGSAKSSLTTPSTNSLITATQPSGWERVLFASCEADEASDAFSLMLAAMEQKPT